MPVVKKTLKKKETSEVKKDTSGIKKGAPDTKAICANPISEGKMRIGIAKGVTINLGNYQSARIEAWAEKIVDSSDHAVNKAITEISELLETVIEEESKELGEEE